MKSVELQDSALRRADPRNWTERTGIRPGEDAVAISGDETLRRQVVVQRNEAEFVGGIGRRPFGSRHLAQERRMPRTRDRARGRICSGPGIACTQARSIAFRIGRQWWV